MIDLDTLETNIQNILQPVIQQVDPSAILIIEPNNAPDPSGSYSTMKLVSMRQLGYAITGLTDSSGNAPIRAEYDLSWEFSSFGENSKNIDANLQFAITNNPTTSEALCDIGLSQFNHTISSDIPRFSASQSWEDRNRTTVQFHYAYEEIVHTDYIETILTEGCYLNPDGTIALQTTNEIDLP